VAKLGFLGLGAMGAPMAARLIEAGHQVTVWNRTRSRAAAFQGRAQIVATPDALLQVLFGDHGVTAGIQPGTTLIDMSTVGPDHLRERR
jgi:3-hydroxyisobutyrate dehydrogenase-like beta-hydroxyacid dehydrogenase